MTVNTHEGCRLDGRDGRYRLQGSATSRHARWLLAEGLDHFSGQRSIEVDLSGVEAADSAGLAVLLAWAERAHARGQVLTFKGLPTQLSAIARVCEVSSLLEPVESVRG